MDLATATINFASTCLGVHEEPKGSNEGPEVNLYLSYVHLQPGSPWCAAFVCYCIGQGSLSSGINSTFHPSGSAIHLATLNPDLIIPSPIPNCIGVIDHGNGLGHAFFIPFTDNNNNCHTIEGNTDHLGSREGWEVAARVRPVDTITYFVRIN